MSTTFSDSPSYLFTSESVTEGHPDKLCDQISDAVLDAILLKDPNARVACETATTTGLVVVMGEITTNTYVDIAKIARDTIKTVGYTSSDYGFDFETCGVVVAVKEQSSDISSAVDHALETRGSSSNVDIVESLGAGDQGMMVGFACNETEELMPLPIHLAHQLTRRLSYVRKEGLIPYLRPDGKSQVTIEYAYGKPVRVHTAIISTQHDPQISPETIERDIKELVISPVLPKTLVDNETSIFVNPSGRFVIGGPKGDAGLTGRKILSQLILQNE